MHDILLAYEILLAQSQNRRPFSIYTTLVTAYFSKSSFDPGKYHHRVRPCDSLIDGLYPVLKVDGHLVVVVQWITRIKT